MEKQALETYARLLAQQGLNLDKGQEVLIFAQLDQPEFVRMVVEECYKAGASAVRVEWRDQACEKLAQLYQTEEKLGTVEDWQEAKMKWRLNTLPAYLYIISEDPDGMNGIDQGKFARAHQAVMARLKPYRDAMENRYQWCIAAVPGRAWAEKVFPGEPDAMEKLWNVILDCARARGDAAANWKEHAAGLHAHADQLNACRFTALEYKSSNGTDFRVGLMPLSRWNGGDGKDLSKRVFLPNIPSEELYITPKRGVAEGLLVATMPLSWQGTLIENFSIRFENGKAVQVHAEKGQEALERMIAMDEGAAYLGECALVPFNSPISRTGILFYETLFDENARCHIALGRGYDDCVENFDSFSQDELHAMGVNDSIIHVDFMIGAEDLDVTGITEDGTRVPVFRKGNWA